MDEPLSSLDQLSKDFYFDIIKKYFKLKTVIVATHETHTLRYYDSIIRIGDGKILDVE